MYWEKEVEVGGFYAFKKLELLHTCWGNFFLNDKWGLLIGPEPLMCAQQVIV